MLHPKVIGKLYPHTLAPDAPERVRPVRMHMGIAPDPLQQPLVIAELHDDADSTTWRLAWVRMKIGSPGKRLATPEPDPNTDWHNCKLYAVGRAIHKANFWVSINFETRRLSFRGDTKALGISRPKLHGAVMHLVTYLASDKRAVEDLDDGASYVVRPSGEGYSVTKMESELDRGVREQMAEMAALKGQLKRLGVGESMLTMSNIAVIKAVDAELRAEGFRFTAHTDALGGINVTRIVHVAPLLGTK